MVFSLVIHFFVVVLEFWGVENDLCVCGDGYFVYGWWFRAGY